MNEAFSALDAKGSAGLSALLKAVSGAFPLSRAHENVLPYKVRDLWASLTQDRAGRRLDYLNEPALRAAYLRYFLPWNVYRYLRFMPALDLAVGLSRFADLGSGPLSFPIALYLARPELRALPLEVDCVDRSAKAMAEGEEILRKLALALTGKELAWRIKRVRASFMEFRGSFPFLSSCYVANELFEKERTGAPEKARILGAKLAELVSPGGSFLLLEPGVPPAAGFLYALRELLLERGWSPLSPCTHANPCPLPPRRGSPWCHFVFDTEGAPKALEELSTKAKLPKERASLSWLAMRSPAASASSGTAATAKTTAPSGAMAPAGGLLARIVSEAFSIPGGEGCYACCAEGRVLLRYGKAGGTGPAAKAAPRPRAPSPTRGPSSSFPRRRGGGREERAGRLYSPRFYR